MTPEDVEHRLETARQAEDRGDFASVELGVREVQAAELSELQRAEVQRLFAMVFASRGDHAQAHELLQNAESIAHALGDMLSLGRISASMGLVYFNQSNYPKALEYYSHALTRYEKLAEKSGIARVLQSIGLVHRYHSDYSKALEYYTQALSLYEELGLSFGIARVTNNIGLVYKDLSDYATALEYYNRALALYEAEDEKFGVASVINDIGNVYLALSEYPAALEYYATSLRLYDELGTVSGVEMVLNNIGLVCLNLSDYPKALEYFTRSLALHEDLGKKSGIATVMSNIAKVHFNLEDFPKALEYYGRALDLHEELGEKMKIARVISNIGLVYYNISDHLKALEYYTRALALDEELGTKYSIGVITANIGLLYADPSFSGYDARKAEHYLLSAGATLEQVGSKKEFLENCKDLSGLYEAEGRVSEALQYYKKYHELEREVLSEEAKQKADEVGRQRLEAEREKQRAIIKARDEERIASQESLLNRMLPPSIAQRLLKGERVADYYRDISVLFADIVGFTPISAQMPAHVVVKFLNYVFGVFDSIMKEHGCEKIKTIGDGYMAVAGAPIECADHAERIAAAAIAMQRDILLPDDIREHIEEGTVFNIRIGIHAGSAVGGIIGDERFVFDVYSDAVNMAARMEQSSEPGKIHVSTDFAMHLQNRMNQTGGESPFKLVRRGQVEIKGKGAVKTYWLEQA